MTNIIKSSAIAVIGWIIFISAAGNYIRLNSLDSPKVNIGDLRTDLTPSERKLPLEVVAQRRGWDLKLPFVSEIEAEKLQRKREFDKVISAVIAIVVGAVLFYCTYLFSGSWFVAINCLFIGPISLTYTNSYDQTFSLGGDAISHAEESNTNLKPDWMAAFLQFCFGAPIGMFIGYTIGDILTPMSILVSAVSLPLLLTGSAFIVGSAFMIHGDRLLSNDHIIPTQGVPHNRRSLNFCRAIFFIGSALFVYSFI